MRRIPSQSLMGPTVGAIRQFLFASEQNLSLENNAKFHKYDSNLWISDPPGFQFRAIQAKPKPDERPTKIRMPIGMELINLDDLEFPPGLPPPGLVEGHAIYPSMKPLAWDTAKKLDMRCKERNLQSKLWTNPGTATKLRLIRKHEAVVHVITWLRTLAVYNACQLENPEAVMTYPVTAGYLKAFIGANVDQFRAYQEENKFRTGIFYLEHHLTKLNLDLKPGAKGCGVRDSTTLYYNVEQVEGAEALVADLPDAKKLTNAVTLRPVELSLEMGIPKFKSKYYLTKYSVEGQNLKVKEGELPLQGLQPSLPLTFYNVDELADPSAGFRLMGTLTR